jgi:hypothetical protein
MMEKLFFAMILGIITFHAQPQSAKKNWSYHEEVDRMTGSKVYSAQVMSSTRKEFSFPYQGGSNFFLILKFENGKNKVVLKVSKGQLVPSYTGETSYRIKFDEEQPINVSPSGTGSGIHNQVFLGSESEIIEKLKSAKKVLIEAECYKAGMVVLDFNVEGLIWEHENTTDKTGN